MLIAKSNGYRNIVLRKKGGMSFLVPPKCLNQGHFCHFGEPKMALQVPESQFRDHFLIQASPQNDTSGTQISPWRVTFGHVFCFVDILMSLGLEPAFGQLCLVGSSGGYTYYMYTSHASQSAIFKNYILWCWCNISLNMQPWEIVILV